MYFQFRLTCQHTKPVFVKVHLVRTRVLDKTIYNENLDLLFLSNNIIYINSHIRQIITTSDVLDIDLLVKAELA